MDHNGQRNAGGRDAVLEQQATEFQHQPHNCNGLPMDVTATHVGNMGYMMPPIPLEQTNSVYGDGTGLYFPSPSFQMYDNAGRYNGNMMPYIPPTVQMIPPYEQYQPMNVHTTAGAFTPRASYHDIAPVRVTQGHLNGKPISRKHKNFLCC
ncbi:uncharacterized protein BXIN_1554 [Babesia sp. Xinjiang]|uniref:uncharacterized protein n=1 Tax=Babesia sp. Xinjiang TaxID=462227 RepID=UPI000A21F5D7|nr:uncharacterized protein BXIN_1554 [Babesia sp. Xinjiang]ORM42310.1 hypothetical protein BXIN_1554 [Babesia sp. Xinjiang]